MYGLCDIIDNNGVVCILVVYGCEGFVMFLVSGILNFKFDSCVFVE